MNEFYIFECPHCQDMIQIFRHEINCHIFRHAVYKNTFMNIGPHESKLKCDELKKNDLVYGCAKPFILKQNGVQENGKPKYDIEICDYI